MKAGIPVKDDEIDFKAIEEYEDTFPTYLRRNERGVETRAVQRSIHDTHTEDRPNAAKGDAVASICDIANSVEAQDVGGERAQACKDAGIAANAAGVFCEATVANIV